MSIKSYKKIEVSDNAWRTVKQLARAPLGDTEETAFLGTISYGKLYTALNELSDEQVVNYVRHGTIHTPWSNRFYLTRRGINYYLFRMGIPISECVQPITREWYRSLFRRIDTVRSVYRIARSFVPADKDYSHDPPEVIWFKQGNWEAALRFHGGAVVPILVQGRDWGLLRFMEKIYELNKYDADRISGALLVTRDPYSQNRALAKLYDLDSRMVAYTCVESNIQMAESYRRIWSGRRSQDGILNAEEVLPNFARRGRLPARKPVKRANFPPVKFSKKDLAIPAMKPAERSHLELIGKCILIRIEDLGKLACIGNRANYARLQSLEKLGLIKYPDIDDAKRVTYSEAAIRMVTYRDRLSYENGLNLRSPEIEKDGRHEGEFRGNLLRDTVRKMGHDDNVYGALGLFSEYAREDHLQFSFDVSWHLHRKYSPPRGKDRQLSPDALIRLSGFNLIFLEVEFRAIGEKWMTKKFLPYIYYYGNAQWQFDHIMEPTTLFIMKDQAEASSMLRYADALMRKSRVSVPLGVTDFVTLSRNNAVSKSIWMTRFSLRSGNRYSLDQRRYFGG